MFPKFDKRYKTKNSPPEKEEQDSRQDKNETSTVTVKEEKGMLPKFDKRYKSKNSPPKKEQDTRQDKNEASTVAVKRTKVMPLRPPHRMVTES
ncbi:hypothetical protein CDAR_301901 [Caerostris darwini]|uniref:Uncharacterized protein n=1 Tax=Caerostris darwini TaxID=1538125 RepID=A0AAV4UGX3_9ARAC|nr:hypothetical protein CDAR_301901 [Caerostris darwini]